MRKTLPELIKRAFEFYKDFRDENKILVYQMGKVGSTSLEGAIPGSLHFHTLYQNNPCWVHQKMRRPGVIGGVIVALGDMIKRFAIRRRHEVKIISMVREPVGRNISMFFQNLPYWYVQHVNVSDYDIREGDLLFLKEVFDKTFDHNYQFDWFDKEIRRLTGIDVFSETYKPEKGYMIIEKGKYKLFLFRLEDVNKALPALNQFTGHSIAMSGKNIGNDKWYACVYRDFNKIVADDLEYREKMVNSRFSAFFRY